MADRAQTELPLATPQAVWRRLPGKNKCVRDPAAGPGTCWYWWKLCPDAERRGCYLLWLREQ